jgi:exosome complex component RRP41
MSVQLLNEQGLRSDGRRPNEIRKLNCKLGVFEQADGSAYIEMGNTKVLAAVYGPHDTRLGKQSKSSGTGHDKAVINCQYSMATFSTNDRKKKPRGDFRSIELKNNLKEIFESAVLTSLYPHSQIDIYVGEHLTITSLLTIF